MLHLNRALRNRRFEERYLIILRNQIFQKKLLLFSQKIWLMRYKLFLQIRPKLIGSIPSSLSQDKTDGLHHLIQIDEKVLKLFKNSNEFLCSSLNCFLRHHNYDFYFFGRLKYGFNIKPIGDVLFGSFSIIETWTVPVDDIIGINPFVRNGGFRSTALTDFYVI